MDFQNKESFHCTRTIMTGNDCCDCPDCPLKSAYKVDIRHLIRNNRSPCEGPLRGRYERPYNNYYFNHNECYVTLIRHCDPTIKNHYKAPRRHYYSVVMYIIREVTAVFEIDGRALLRSKKNQKIQKFMECEPTVNWAP